MDAFEIFISLQENIKKLYHLLKVELLVFIQLESFNRQLYSDGQLTAIASKDNLCIFVDNSRFYYGLVVSHHTEDLNLYLIEIQSFSEIDVCGGFFGEGLHHFVLISSRKICLFYHEFHGL